MLCSIKVNRNTIEVTLLTSCYFIKTYSVLNINSIYTVNCLLLPHYQLTSMKVFSSVHKIKSEIIFLSNNKILRNNNA